MRPMLESLSRALYVNLDEKLLGSVQQRGITLNLLVLLNGASMRYRPIVRVHDGAVSVAARAAGAVPAVRVSSVCCCTHCDGAA